MPPKKKSSSEVVYAAANCGTETAEGLTVNLRRGDCWAADDPFVLSHPSLFQEEAIPRRTVAAPVVEQATRNPGERRTTQGG